jgi:hypothetical protein
MAASVSARGNLGGQDLIEIDSHAQEVTSLDIMKGALHFTIIVKRTGTENCKPSVSR